ncbi:MAG: aminoacyl-tRNA hydrolase [Deltaproteobacteria bacterium]|nr:aminoacyl-tRNA hydrolase [Deltaproteobacteria bacterium]MBW2415829.1 aminoacyl-tRNA hydrolase [Deltaproteobacteria bacterium]
MRLIVGLGNPGARYKDTPHNAGFQACDRFAERHRLGRSATKFQGVFWRGRAHNEDIGVLKPQTYMNLSGQSLAEALRYLPAEAKDVIVVFDDMDTPAGRLRIRKQGGHGGHNGLRSVTEHLGSGNFPRIRIGVGRPPGQRDATSHLLNRVRKSERERFSETVDLAVDALDAILTKGIDLAMNHYNSVVIASEEDEEEGEK